jgi:hypothetical protein
MLLRKGFGLIKPFLINFFTMNVTPKSRIRHFSTWLDVPEKVVPSPLPQQHPMLSSLLAQPIYFHRKVEKVMAYHDLAEAVQAVLGDNITKAEAYKWVQYLKFFRKQNFVGDIMWTHLTPQQWVRKSLDHYCPHFKSWKSPTAVHDNIKTSEVINQSCIFRHIFAFPAILFVTF